MSPRVAPHPLKMVLYTVLIRWSAGRGGGFGVRQDRPDFYPRHPHTLQHQHHHPPPSARHPQHHHPPTVFFGVQNFASATSRTLWSRRFFGSSCRITTLCDLPWLACRTHSAQRRPCSAARRIDSRAPARNYYTPLQWRRRRCRRRGWAPPRDPGSRRRPPCSTKSRTGTMRRFVDSVVPALRR